MRLIPAVQKASGTIAAPASKSYTARALLMAAMTEGETTIENALDCDDARYMLEAIRSIGYDVSGTFAGGITIGARISMSASEVELGVGNAGTAMRFLTGFLAFVPGRFILRGEERMHQRPIGDLIDALVSIGIETEYLGVEGYPPIRIRGRVMRGGWEVEISGETSSQFVSALMMGGSTLPAGITLSFRTLSSASYVELTKDILRRFGATVEELSPSKVKVTSGGLSLEKYRVEGDYSSASYWFAAAAATQGRVTVTGLDPDSAQGDRQFLAILKAMGCDVEWNGDAVTVSGPEQLLGGRFDCNTCPDIVPTLAAIAPLASSPVEVVNVSHLRVKESDRIASVAGELRKLGARVEEREDGMQIHPGWTSEAATIDPHGDHRLAMCFAVAGLARGGVTIDHEEVVSKSYPQFWRRLETLIASST